MHRIATTIGLAILTAMAPAARAGSLGPAALPPLQRPAPVDVPTLGDPAVLSLWRHHESSPLLRDPGIEAQLARAVIALRAEDPDRFDRGHPTIGKLIRNPAYLDRILAAYESHPARFTSYHHHLVPLLRGLSLVEGEQITAPPVPEVPPGPGAQPGPGPAPAVPGPPGLVLMGLGLVGVVARALLTLPGLKHLGFSVQPTVPTVAGLTGCP